MTKKHFFVENNILTRKEMIENSLRFNLIELFSEIDEGILNNLSEKPIKLKDSKFLKAYNKIKKKWLK